MDSSAIGTLRTNGVKLLAPESIYIAPDVDLNRIGTGTTIHPGCRVSGANTSIGPNCELGAETPLTLENCQLSANVKLKGGFCSESIFLDGASAGSGAHIRPGCLLEEQASVAHAVGLKQSILFPFATTGSLINFCDALIAGGSGPKNHSEIGSSYIHFNFTPQSDKATPSMLGDVPRGVMLNCSPVFLGGQGGLVGPARIAFGTVIPAGAVFRGDALQEGMLQGRGNLPAKETQTIDLQCYRSIRRKVNNNMTYLGQLAALREWYTQVRAPLFVEPWRKACLDGALQVIDLIWKERLKRLDDFSARLQTSVKRLKKAAPARPYIAEQEQFIELWPAAKQQLDARQGKVLSPPERNRFLKTWHSNTNVAYIAAIQSLPPVARLQGSTWLQAIADDVAAKLILKK